MNGTSNNSSAADEENKCCIYHHDQIHRGRGLEELFCTETPAMVKTAFLDAHESNKKKTQWNNSGVDIVSSQVSRLAAGFGCGLGKNCLNSGVKKKPQKQKGIAILLECCNVCLCRDCFVTEMKKNESYSDSDSFGQRTACFYCADVMNTIACIKFHKTDGLDLRTFYKSQYETMDYPQPEHDQGDNATKVRILTSNDRRLLCEKVRVEMTEGGFVNGDYSTPFHGGLTKHGWPERLEKWDFMTKPLRERWSRDLTPGSVSDGALVFNSKAGSNTSDEEMDFLIYTEDGVARNTLANVAYGSYVMHMHEDRKSMELFVSNARVLAQEEMEEYSTLCPYCTTGSCNATQMMFCSGCNNMHWVHEAVSSHEAQDRQSNGSGPKAPNKRPREESMESIDCNCCITPGTIKVPIEYHYNKRFCPPNNKERGMIKTSLVAIRKHNPFNDQCFFVNNIVDTTLLVRNAAPSHSREKLRTYFKLVATPRVVAQMWFQNRASKPIRVAPAENESIKQQMATELNSFLYHIKDKADDYLSGAHTKIMNDKKKTRGCFAILHDIDKEDRLPLIECVVKQAKDVATVMLKKLENQPADGFYMEPAEILLKIKDSLLEKLQSIDVADEEKTAFKNALQNVSVPERKKVNRNFLSEWVKEMCEEAFKEGMVCKDLTEVEVCAGAVANFGNVLASLFLTFPSVEGFPVYDHNNGDVKDQSESGGADR
jgi:hypothetical protein